MFYIEPSDHEEENVSNQQLNDITLADEFKQYEER